MSLYQDGDRGRSILFSVSHLLISLPSEGQTLWANQISSTYLNCRLIYNYFRFWKPNVRHIGNLLSVSISTICQKSAHYSASGYWILSKSKHPLRKYDVISISQDGGRDGWILLPVSYLLMSLPSEGQSLVANQILSRYLKWRLRYILWQSKMAWEGVKKNLKSRMCQYPGMLCYILWIQKCIFYACRLSWHNSTPIHYTTKVLPSYKLFSYRYPILRYKNWPLPDSLICRRHVEYDSGH